MTWSFKWLTSWDEVWQPSFVGQWTRWLAGNPTSHVFFHPSMVRAWVETYLPLRRIEPRFCTAQMVAQDTQGSTPNNHSLPAPGSQTHDAQRTTHDASVFLPLILDRGGWKDAWLRVLQPVGHNEFDYHDPLFCERTGITAETQRSQSSEETTSPLRALRLCGENSGYSAAEAQRAGFWDAFREEVERRNGEFDLFCIPRLRECCIGKESHNLVPGSPEHRTLNTGPSVKECSMFSVQVAEKSPYIDLAKYDSYGSFMMSRSGNLRQGLRRKQKKLAREGEVKFKVFAPTETSQALDALAAFRKNHEMRWPRAYRAPGLYENLIRHALPAGLLHLSTIECGGRTASWHFGFVHNKRFYWYVPVYDNSFAQFSPGLLHIARLVEECYRLGLTAFDFLRGEERYKYEWTEDEATLYCLDIRNRNPIAGAKSALRTTLRRAAGVLRRHCG